MKLLWAIAGFSIAALAFQAGYLTARNEDLESDMEDALAVADALWGELPGNAGHNEEPEWLLPEQ